MQRLFQSAWLILCLGLLSGALRAQPAQPAEHILGPGDVIRVTVFQNPDLSLETRISERGQITFPLIGGVSLGGLSVDRAQNLIATRLRDGGFVLRPQVSILVVQVRSAQVSVLGQVSSPGRYPIETGTSKVSEIIAAAGGLTADGGEVVTLVGTRDGKPVRLEIDLPTIFQTGRLDQDVEVANGDIIYVGRAPSFYIYGEVQSPGAFRLERGMTLMQALAQGGGLTPRGTERGIRIHRRGADGRVQVLEVGMDAEVLRDDVIYVRQSLF